MDCMQAGAHTQKQNQDLPSPALAPTCPGAPQLKKDKHTAIKWVTLRYARAPSARDSAREGQTKSLLRFAHGRTRARTHKSPEENKAETHIWTAKAQMNGSEEHKVAKPNFRNQIWYSFPWATWNERTNNKERYPPDTLDAPSARCSSMGSSAACASPSLPLYGITCTQTYVYYERSAGDRPPLKTLVRPFSSTVIFYPITHFCNTYVHTPRVSLDSRLRWTNAYLFLVTPQAALLWFAPPSLALTCSAF
ncbi:hypothetical protein HETIRDRAFT_108163 [Heterobasidion irregulare TC 32-1]|uniref:Uncharacterized protein n=1 Tax=Heterobasidion irregulare (strain TC 32-1) TaxID=747525 RepID=W4JQ72_HETIT|nr:uncharacterized protein HETIRDRAFT_108163 [Heterobasidion irregulare TC 32-1]ETW75230.1 hypothetical protein HETIRDRAFT_108163 [Heterobasidion irregulare TC 32-1]